MKQTILLFLFLLTFLLTSCISLPQNQDLQGETELTTSEQLTPDILYERYENPSYPLIYHIVKINLNNSIKILASPKIIYNDYSVKGETTYDFANRNNCIVAINTIPFANKLTKSIPVGIWYDDKTLISEPISKYSCISINSNRVQIYTSQDKADYQNSQLTIGGFFTILKDGNLYGDYIDNKDSRTAIGVSEDGQTLVILCVEGEKKSQSIGLSYKGCAEILLQHNAYNAIEFDGGSSTSLCINGKNVLSYKPQKKVAANLGFIEK